MNTAAGKFISNWEYDEFGKVIYKIQIPFDARVIVNLMEGEYIVNGKEVEKCYNQR